MPDDPAESPVERFLDRYRKDRDEDTVRELHEYLLDFPGDDDGIAAEWVVLKLERGAEAGVGADHTVGPYRIERELGRGGQGVVYLAEDTRLHRKVALKVLTALGPGHEDTVKRFQREAEVASKLEHPGICSVHDAGAANGVPYIAMQLVQGETLAQRIAASKAEGDAEDDVSTFEVTEGPEAKTEADASKEVAGAHTTSTHLRKAEVMRVVETFEKLARALHAAHEVGIIHRDIKPGNVMVTPDEQPVILDFGLARDEGADLQTLTRDGDMFGTPAYMSPEQLMGQRIHLDRRTDVYSLGATLFECLTLTRPFAAPTREALFQAVLTDEPPDARRLNPAVPRDLRVVVDAALEKNRDRRYQTALDLAEDLRRVREREPISAKPVGPLGRVLRWAHRQPYRAASVLLLFAIVAAVSWYVAKAPQRADNAAKARLQEAEMRRLRVEDMLQDGFLSMQSELFADALKTFNGALSVDAASAEAVAGKAMALSRLDRNDDARALLRSHLSDGDPSGGLAHVLEWVRRRDNKEVGDTPAEPPSTAQGHFILGYLGLSEGWGKDEALCRRAFSHLTRATLMSPPRCLYLVHRVRAASQVKEPETARESIEILKHLWPDDGYAWYGIGFAQSVLGDEIAAAAAYRRASELLPEFTVVHLNLAFRLIALRRYEEALVSAERATTLTPRLAKTWLVRATALWHLGSFEDAIADYKKCMTLAENNGEAWTGIAFVRRSQKRYDEAIEAFMKVLAIRPDDHLTWHHIGNVHNDRGDQRGAMEAHKKALAISPDYQFAHDGLIAACEAAGDLEAVIDEAKRWAEVHPDDAAPQEELALTLLRLARRDKSLADAPTAVRAAREAVALTQERDPFKLRTLALTLAANDQQQEAIPVCEKALKLIEKDNGPDPQLKADLEASLRRYKRAAGNQ